MRNVLVTNAASTIGQAITKQMVSNGFQVLAIVNSWDEAKVISRRGVDPIVLNVNKTSSVLKFFKIYGSKIDAVIMYVGGFETDQKIRGDESSENYESPVNINTWYFFVQALLPFMNHKRAGKIVLLGSKETSSIDDALQTGGYSVSKNALLFLADLINNSNPGSKIRANVLIPQFFNYPEEGENPHVDRYHLINPETIANTIQFMFSNAGKHFIQEVVPFESSFSE